MRCLPMVLKIWTNTRDIQGIGYLDSFLGAIYIFTHSFTHQLLHSYGKYLLRTFLKQGSVQGSRGCKNEQHLLFSKSLQFNWTVDNRENYQYRSLKSYEM